jgi:2-iminobutanoate/2-iminopropanoate deaminase
MQATQKKVITTDRAPKPVGPYSPGIRYSNLIFTAGQVGLDPATGAIVTGGIETQTRQILTNIRNILEAGGSSLNCVLKTTVYMQNLGDFSRMNAVYAEFFPENPPARTTIGVAVFQVVSDRNRDDFISGIIIYHTIK